MRILSSPLIQYLKDPVPGSEVKENIEKYFEDTEMHIRNVHTEKYLSRLASACEVSMRWEDANMDLSPETLVSVKASVALGLTAAFRPYGFAITAPAGHHAYPDRAGALCLVNTVMVVAKALRGLGKRVAIIDIDGHHGDGTEAACRAEEGIFFSSIYQKDAFPFLPHLRHGYDSGTVVRMPILAGSGDVVFLAALEGILARVREFRPDHILVSAGFDGYIEDKMLDLRYSMRGYHEAGRRIASLGISVSAVLEGGYTRFVPQCIRAFSDGVSGIPWSSEDGFTDSPSECTRDCERMLASIA